MMRRLPLFILLMVCGLVAFAQKPKVLKAVRSYLCTPQMNSYGYDSTLQSEILYDRKGRPVERTYFHNGRLYNRSLTTYDAKNRPISSIVQDSLGRPQKYYAFRYDRAGKLILELEGHKADSLKPIRSWHYQRDFLMRVDELAFAPAQYRAWIRDSLGNPMREVYEDSISGGPRILATYAWDDAQRRWLRQKEHGNNMVSVDVCKDANCQQYLRSEFYRFGVLENLNELDSTGLHSRTTILESNGKIRLMQASEYDKFHNLIRQWDPRDSLDQAHPVREFVSDQQGHGRQEFTYDAHGQKNLTMDWEYDSLGRCVREMDMRYLRTRNMTYDARNRLASMLEIHNHDTLRYAYTYDQYDSLRSVVQLGPVGVDGSPTESLIYLYSTEINGRTTTRIQRGAADGEDQWLMLTVYNDGLRTLACRDDNVCNRYIYDGQGRLQEEGLYYGSERSTGKRYSYDAQGRLAHVAEYASNTITITDYSYPAPNICLLTQRPALRSKTAFLVSYW